MGEFVKVCVGSAPEEMIWAEIVSDGLLLQNTPFIADGYNVNDIVSGKKRGTLRSSAGVVNVYDCTGIVRRGGWGTLRVWFSYPVKGHVTARALADVMIGLGCSCEATDGISLAPNMITFSVPPHVLWNDIRAAWKDVIDSCNIVKITSNEVA